MRAGYQRDRNASAKALTAAIKNSRKDKVLYGAVIKAESVFSTMGTSSLPPLPPTLIQPTPPPPPPAAPSVSPSAPSMAPSSISSLTRPVHPLAELIGRRSGRTLPELRTTGSAGPTPTSTPSGPSSAPPSLSGDRVTLSPDVLSAAIGGLRKTPPRIAPPKKTSPLLSEFNEKMAARISPVDSRKSNVELTSPTSGPSAPASTTIPTSAARSPIAVSPPILQERTFETLKPTKGPPSSTAPTSPTSSIATTLPPPPSSPPPSDASPPSPPRKSYDPHGDEIQAKAAELFAHIQEARVKAGIKSTKQTTFAPFTLLGQMPNDRIIMKLETNGKLRFDLKKRGTLMGKKGDQGVDLMTSIENALDVMKKGRYNVNRKTGEMTGLGLNPDEDPTKISSDRVVYSSRKDAKHVKKGQLYLMEPQLIKGHVRLYNKSGRPVVSRANVSPSFQRMAKDIVERNTFEADDYATLDPKETADANKFIQATKPIQPRNIDRLSNADTVWQLKKRYEVLVGQLAAGNTGKLVRDEMETILRDLMRLHAMNMDKGRDLIRSLRAF